VDVNMRQRPPARDITTVFILGIVGTLVPIVGWLIGAALVLRASSWSTVEKAAAIIGPLVALLAVVALIATATGADLRLPLLAAVPLTTSLSSAAGAVYLALRLVAHKQAAETGQR
jgi:uncharacterized membrane protein